MESRETKVMSHSLGSDSPIRVATAADAAALQAIYAPYVAETVTSFETEPPSAEEMAARVARIGAVYPWLVYERDGAVQGYAYAGRHSERAAYDWSVDTTVYVARDAHRRGVGRALYQSLLRVLDAQGFHCAYGGITLPNESSVGLHEALGYRPIGVWREVGFKFGAWRDVGWWGLALNAPDPAPKPPRRFAPEMLG